MADPIVNVRINGDATGLQRATDTGKNSVMSMASGLRNLAGAIGVAFSARAVIGWASDAMRAADATVTFAEGLGESVQNVTALTKAASESGVEHQRMLNWLQKIKDVQEQIARDGANTQLGKAIAALGVDLEKFINLSPAQAFMELTRAARDTGEGVNVLNLAFGRMAASDALDVAKIIQAAGGWDAYAESVKGVAASTERLAAAQDRIDKIKTRVKENWTDLVDSFLVGARVLFSEDMAEEVKAMQKEELERRQKNNPGASLAPPTSDGPDAKGRALVEKMASEQAIKDFLKSEENRFRSTDPKLLQNELKRAEDDYRKLLATSDNPDFVKKFKAWMEQLAKVVEENQKDSEQDFKDRLKREADLAKQNADNAIKENAIQRKAWDALDAITVPLPRLSGYESVGAVLGGSGGYSSSIAERMARQIEIQAQMKLDLAEIKANTLPLKEGS